MRHRKTCIVCKGPTHKTHKATAQCTFEFYKAKQFTREQQLACVTLSFGLDMSEVIARENPPV